MSDYLFDSSALVKRYIPETGTPWVRTLTANRGNSILIAQITQIEVVSAMMRLTRDGRFSLQTAQSIRKLLERHVAHEYTVVGLTASVGERAKDLLEAYPFRAYDAIQLASALEVDSRLVAAGQPSLIFVSADVRLLSVANAEALTTDDPNLYA